MAAVAEVRGEASLVKFDFYGDELDILRDEDGGAWVSVRRVCDALGLASNMQVEKLKKKPWACGMLSISRDSTGRKQRLYWLPFRSLPMWLATIEPTRSTSTVLAGKLRRFQLEAAEVLADHFLGKRGVASVDVDKLNAKVQLLTEQRDSARLQCLDADRRVRMFELAQRSTVCDAELAQIRGLLVEVVDLWLALGRADTKRAALQLVKHRAIPGAFSKGFRMRFLPKDQVPGILRALEVLRSDAQAEAVRRGVVPAPARRRHPVLNLRK